MKLFKALTGSLLGKNTFESKKKRGLKRFDKVNSFGSEQFRLLAKKGLSVQMITL